MDVTMLLNVIFPELILLQLFIVFISQGFQELINRQLIYIKGFWILHRLRVSCLCHEHVDSRCYPLRFVASNYTGCGLGR